ncbi:MAG: hypothetical protein ACPG4T_07210 [Nannocystaceae bacterium]
MKHLFLALPIALLLVTPGCSDDAPAQPLAKKTEKLAPETPKSMGAMTFEIEGSEANVEFSMDAPFEKIRGRVPATAINGTLHIDLDDLTKTTGLVHVDLAELELFQRVANDDGNFGEEIKSAGQNEHARNWLEIGPDAPDDVRAKNNRVEFSLKEVKSPSATDIKTLKGDVRSVTFTATGDFLLHQRAAAKTTDIEMVFHFKGDTVEKVAVKTVKPLAIGLDEYDVRPREAFGKLAAKTLAAVSSKVAKEAAVSVAFVATAKPGAKPAAAAKPAEVKAAAKPGEEKPKPGY